MNTDIKPGETIEASQNNVNWCLVVFIEKVKQGFVVMHEGSKSVFSFVRKIKK